MLLLLHRFLLSSAVVLLLTKGFQSSRHIRRSGGQGPPVQLGPGGRRGWRAQSWLQGKPGTIRLQEGGIAWMKRTRRKPHSTAYLSTAVTETANNEADKVKDTAVVTQSHREYSDLGLNPAVSLVSRTAQPPLSPSPQRPWLPAVPGRTHLVQAQQGNLQHSPPEHTHGSPLPIKLRQHNLIALAPQGEHGNYTDTGIIVGAANQHEDTSSTAHHHEDTSSTAHQHEDTSSLIEHDASENKAQTVHVKANERLKHSLTRQFRWRRWNGVPIRAARSSDFEALLGSRLRRQSVNGKVSDDNEDADNDDSKTDDSDDKKGDSDDSIAGDDMEKNFIDFNDPNNDEANADRLLARMLKEEVPMPLFDVGDQVDQSSVDQSSGHQARKDQDSDRPDQTDRISLLLADLLLDKNRNELQMGEDSKEKGKDLGKELAILRNQPDPEKEDERQFELESLQSEKNQSSRDSGQDMTGQGDEGSEGGAKDVEVETMDLSKVKRKRRNSVHSRNGPKNRRKTSPYILQHTSQHGADRAAQLHNAVDYSSGDPHHHTTQEISDGSHKTDTHPFDDISEKSHGDLQENRFFNPDDKNGVKTGASSGDEHQTRVQHDQAMVQPSRKSGRTLQGNGVTLCLQLFPLTTSRLKSLKMTAQSHTGNKHGALLDNILYVLAARTLKHTVLDSSVLQEQHNDSDAGRGDEAGQTVKLYVRTTGRHRKKKPFRHYVRNQQTKIRQLYAQLLTDRLLRVFERGTGEKEAAHFLKCIEVLGSDAAANTGSKNGGRKHISYNGDYSHNKDMLSNDHMKDTRGHRKEKDRQGHKHKEVRQGHITDDALTSSIELDMEREVDMEGEQGMERELVVTAVYHGTVKEDWWSDTGITQNSTKRSVQVAHKEEQSEYVTGRRLPSTHTFASQVMHKVENELDVRQNNMGNETTERINTYTAQIAEGMDTAQIAEGMDTAQIADGMDTAQIAEGMDTAQIAEGMDTAQIADGMDTAQRAEGMDTAQIADGMDTAQIADGMDTAQIAEGMDTAQIAEGKDTPQIAVGKDTAQRVKGTDTDGHISIDSEDSDNNQPWPKTRSGTHAFRTALQDVKMSSKSNQSEEESRAQVASAPDQVKTSGDQNGGRKDSHPKQKSITEGDGSVGRSLYQNTNGNERSMQTVTHSSIHNQLYMLERNKEGEASSDQLKTRHNPLKWSTEDTQQIRLGKIIGPHDPLRRSSKSLRLQEEVKTDSEQLDPVMVKLSELKPKETFPNIYRRLQQSENSVQDNDQQTGKVIGASVEHLQINLIDMKGQVDGLQQVHLRSPSEASQKIAESIGRSRDVQVSKQSTFHGKLANNQQKSRQHTQRVQPPQLAVEEKHGKLAGVNDQSESAFKQKRHKRDDKIKRSDSFSEGEQSKRAENSDQSEYKTKEENEENAMEKQLKLVNTQKEEEEELIVSTPKEDDEIMNKIKQTDDGRHKGSDEEINIDNLIQQSKKEQEVMESRQQDVAKQQESMEEKRKNVLTKLKDVQKKQEDVEKKQKNTEKKEIALEKARENMEKDRENIEKELEYLEKNREEMEKTRERMEKTREGIERSIEIMAKTREEMVNDKDKHTESISSAKLGNAVLKEEWQQQPQNTTEDITNEEIPTASSSLGFDGDSKQSKIQDVEMKQRDMERKRGMNKKQEDNKQEVLDNKQDAIDNKQDVIDNKQDVIDNKQDVIDEKQEMERKQRIMLKKERDMEKKEADFEKKAEDLETISQRLNNSFSSGISERPNEEKQADRQESSTKHKGLANNAAHSASSNKNLGVNVQHNGSSEKDRRVIDKGKESSDKDKESSDTDKKSSDKDKESSDKDKGSSDENMGIFYKSKGGSDNNLESSDTDKGSSDTDKGSSDTDKGLGDKDMRNSDKDLGSSDKGKKSIDTHKGNGYKGTRSGKRKGSIDKGKGSNGKGKRSNGKGTGSSDKDEGSSGKAGMPFHTVLKATIKGTGTNDETISVEEMEEDRGGIDKGKGSSDKDKGSSDKDKGISDTDQRITDSNMRNRDKDLGRSDTGNGRRGKSKGSTRKGNGSNGKGNGRNGKGKGRNGKDKGRNGKDKGRNGKDKGSRGQDKGSIDTDKGNGYKGKRRSGKGKGSIDKGKGSNGKGKGSSGKGKRRIGKGKGSSDKDKGSIDTDQGITDSNMRNRDKDLGSSDTGNGRRGKSKGSSRKGKGRNGKGKGSNGKGNGRNGNGKGSRGQDKGSFDTDKGNGYKGKRRSGKGKGSVDKGKGSNGKGTGSNDKDEGSSGKVGMPFHTVLKATIKGTGTKDETISVEEIKEDMGGIDKDKGSSDKDKESSDKDKGISDTDQRITDSNMRNSDKELVSSGKGKGSNAKGKGSNAKGKGSNAKDNGNIDIGKGSIDTDEGNGYKDKGNSDKDNGNSDKDKENSDKDKGISDKDKGSSDKDKGSSDTDQRITDSNMRNSDKGLGSSDTGNGRNGNSKGSSRKGNGSNGKGKGSNGKGNGSNGKDNGRNGKGKRSNGKGTGSSDKDEGSSGKVGMPFHKVLKATIKGTGTKDETISVEEMEEDMGGIDKGKGSSDKVKGSSDKDKESSDKDKESSDKEQTELVDLPSEQKRLKNHKQTPKGVEKAEDSQMNRLRQSLTEIVIESGREELVESPSHRDNRQKGRGKQREKTEEKGNVDSVSETEMSGSDSNKLQPGAQEKEGNADTGDNPFRTVVKATLNDESPNNKTMSVKETIADIVTSNNSRQAVEGKEKKTHDTGSNTENLSAGETEEDGNTNDSENELSLQDSDPESDVEITADSAADRDDATDVTLDSPTDLSSDTEDNEKNIVLEETMMISQSMDQ